MHNKQWSLMLWWLTEAKFEAKISDDFYGSVQNCGMIIANVSGKPQPWIKAASTLRYCYISTSSRFIITVENLTVAWSNHWCLNKMDVRQFADYIYTLSNGLYFGKNFTDFVSISGQLWQIGLWFWTELQTDVKPCDLCDLIIRLYIKQIYICDITFVWRLGPTDKNYPRTLSYSLHAFIMIPNCRIFLHICGLFTANVDRNMGQNHSTESHLLEIYQAGTRPANGFQTEAIAVTLENMKATWSLGNHGYSSVLYTNLDNIAIKIQTESSNK